ncbi:MAG: hypothetical protein WC107_02465 [Patescibacteria group bacterium]
MDKKYKKEDFELISWSEYQKILDKLYGKIDNYLEQTNTKIDAIVPMLRGGGVPGLILAFKLRLLNIFPVQYKYLIYNEKTETKGILTPSMIDYPMPDSPTFLLVENNHCTGSTFQIAAIDLRKKFPNCKIIYAAARMDYSHQQLEFAEASFYGELSNESRKLSESESSGLSINNRLAIYPWESLEEEWFAVQEKTFDYQNISKIFNDFESKKN